MGAIITASNPALGVFVSDDWEAGISVFSPRRSYEASSIPEGQGNPGDLLPLPGGGFFPTHTIGTGKVDTELTTEVCQSAGALHLEEETIDTVVTCTAATVLSTGDNVVVVSPGGLTLRAGQAIEIGDGLSVTTGTLEAEIDPALLPP